MDDATGKFALVLLRADRVRVHHKRTKHEYLFSIADTRLGVGDGILYANSAVADDPRTYREQARVAAEWFVVNSPTTTAQAANTLAKHGWFSAR
jgi:hypothetical protein